MTGRHVPTSWSPDGTRIFYMIREPMLLDQQLCWTLHL